MLFHSRQISLTVKSIGILPQEELAGAMRQNKHCPVGHRQETFCHYFAPKAPSSVSLLVKSSLIIALLKAVTGFREE
jgi:hypothetical protein